MDIAIIYEKIKTSEEASTYILKPVDVEIGMVDESRVFKTEGEEFCSFNDVSKLKDEYVFYGNPIKIEKLAKLTNYNYRTPDFNYALADLYYQRYSGNILSATIKGDEVLINQIDLSKMSNCVLKEGLNKFVEDNSYLAIMYEKEKISRDDSESTYLVKPIGIMYGSYDEEADRFKVEDKLYAPFDDKEALMSNDDVFFYSVSKVSDLMDIDREITKEDLESLSEKYFKSNSNNIAICRCSEPFSTLKFNTDDIAKSMVEEKLTESDEIIDKTIDGALNMLNRELNDRDKEMIYDFYKLLLRFCYVEGEINGVSAKEVTFQTYNLCLNALYEIETAINSLDIRKEVTEMQPSLKTNPNIKPKEEKTSVNTLSKIIYPEYSYDDLYKGITDVVVDQDEHVEKIVSVLYKRLVELNLDSNMPSQFGLLVTGSTGVGKSEIFKTFSSLVDLPIQFMDATQLTSAGYVGRDIESYLDELLDKCDGDVNLANHAIMILDEVDKIKASETMGKDVNGKAVQDMFLKFMDGTEYNLGSQMFGGPSEVITTSSMTPISIGAFTDMYKEKKKSNLGFGNTEDIKKNKEINTMDFVNYGMSDEFMGRHYITVHLNDLNEASLLRILKKSSKSPLKIQKAIFENLGVECIFTPEYQKAVAAEAIKRKIGARSLASIVANTTWMPIAEIDKHRGEYKKLVFKKETVSDPKKYELRRD